MSELLRFIYSCQKEIPVCTHTHTSTYTHKHTNIQTQATHTHTHTHKHGDRKLLPDANTRYINKWFWHWGQIVGGSWRQEGHEGDATGYSRVQQNVVTLFYKPWLRAVLCATEFISEVANLRKVYLSTSTVATSSSKCYSPSSRLSLNPRQALSPSRNHHFQPCSGSLRSGSLFCCSLPQPRASTSLLFNASEPCLPRAPAPVSAVQLTPVGSFPLTAWLTIVPALSVVAWSVSASGFQLAAWSTSASAPRQLAVWSQPCHSLHLCHRLPEGLCLCLQLPESPSLHPWRRPPTQPPEGFHSRLRPPMCFCHHLRPSEGFNLSWPPVFIDWLPGRQPPVILRQWSYLHPGMFPSRHFSPQRVTAFVFTTSFQRAFIFATSFQRIPASAASLQRVPAITYCL